MPGCLAPKLMLTAVPCCLLKEEKVVCSPFNPALFRILVYTINSAVRQPSLCLNYSYSELVEFGLMRFCCVHKGLELLPWTELALLVLSQKERQRKAGTGILSQQAESKVRVLWLPLKCCMTCLSSSSVWPQFLLQNKRMVQFPSGF